MIEKVKIAGEFLLYSGFIYAGVRLMYLSWKDHNREGVVTVRKITSAKGDKNHVPSRG